MRFGILVARQRSGTGALGSVLDKHAQLKYLGEIFHPDNAGQSDNFFNHMQARIASDPTNAYPDRNEENLLSYVEAQADRLGGRTPVIDIKYRSLHHLNGGWIGLVERPWVLNYAMRNGLPIIHLTRKNFLETFVSGRLAEANKVWHTANADDVKVQSVVVNVRHLSHYMATAKRETALVEQWISGYRKCVSVDYAELFDDGGCVSAENCDAFAASFDVSPFEQRTPSFVKQASSSLSDTIENYELVQQALAGTEFEWMTQG